MDRAENIKDFGDRRADFADITCKFLHGSPAKSVCLLECIRKGVSYWRMLYPELYSITEAPRGGGTSDRPQTNERRLQ